MVDLDNITKFLKVINGKRILYLTICIVIGLISYGVWENRALIYSIIFPVKISGSNIHIESLSEKSKATIANVLAKSRNDIVAVHVTSVDFQKNTRRAIYFSTENDEFRSIFESFNKSRLADLPFLNQDPNNNMRMIGLINGEFSCPKFSETMAFRAAPEGAKFAKQVCSIGIPPYYGKFSGFVAVYLVKEVSPAEIGEIKIIARDIALDIFENDVVK